MSRGEAHPRIAALAALLLSFALATACALPPRGRSSGGAATGTIAIVPDDPNDDPHDFGRPGDPAGYSHSKAMAAMCNCLADAAERSLEAAVAEVSGRGAPRPALDPTLTAMMTCSATQSGGVALPPPVNLPSIGAPRRGGDVASKAKARGLGLDLGADGTMHVTPATAGNDDARALDRIASAVSGALRVSTLVEQQCNAMALQRATSLVMNVSTRDVNSGLADLPGYVAKERARLHRVIAAAKRADAIAASSSTLAASLRGAVEAGSGKTVDATAAALAAALPVAPFTATDEELDALMAAGQHDAGVILEKAHEWARAQVAAGHGIGSPGGMGAASASGGPVLAAPDTSDATAVAGAFMGLFRGDIGAIVRGAAVLFPQDSPIRHGLAATGALLQGDVVNAVRSAAKMVPADSSIGQAIATAQSLMDTGARLAPKG
jgi:hypothetical protein